MPDRMGALVSAARSQKRGGTLSISGVYMGAFPLVPLGELFDRQLTFPDGASERPPLDRRDPAAPGRRRRPARHRRPRDPHDAAAGGPARVRAVLGEARGAIKIVLRP